ncbi:MAG: hypothetical protein KDA99_12205, partial [Planctomycetales bacterium]|nr:hypothetical protein [Planctomycetales bacterium]
GAAHTTDQDSAMRPVLGDGKPRVASFRIGFDPINARIVNLMGREIRDRHIRSLGQVSRMTLLDLRTEYAKLAALERNDETAKRYLGFIDRCLRQNPSRP